VLEKVSIGIHGFISAALYKVLCTSTYINDLSKALFGYWLFHH